MLSWEPDDRSKLIAHLLDEGQRCGVCGSSEWEWREDRYAYEAAAHTCRGCQILDVAKEDESPGPGTRMVLIAKERAERIRGV